ncbi:MAG: carbon-nitrogen hydrolase family protein, partial [Armatimonadetes bacterium]|nr:carbon-nitrogen hydrolase family protein [Armatimonadota bacterium]
RKACSSRKHDLVVTPFLPFLSYREGHEGDDLAAFAELAKRYRTYLIVGMVEDRKDGRRSHTSLLLSREGTVAGRYRKTHALPEDDGIELGGDLPVFRTDFGTIGLSLTTDLYFPEVYWVQKMKGAQILAIQTAPERFRQYWEWPALLKARCLDTHAHAIVAMYADPRTYITNRYEMGMQGATWGRSMILNRVGTPVADTGHDAGVATAVVDLDQRKKEVYAPFYEAENIFFCNCLGDRKAFQPLTEPYRPLRRPSYAKRTARIAVGYFWGKDTWSDSGIPEVMLHVLDQAAPLKPDLILLSEMSAKITSETTQKVAKMVGERAREMNCYIVIGGVGDEDQISIARVWDREGKEVFQEPIYWTKGFPEIKVFDTDFARLGLHTCGDLYTGEIDRVLTVKGAELILDPSQHWGADGENNELMLRARACENGVWVACAHWNTSDPGLRSLIVDPYGYVMAASHFQQEGVVYTDINFDDTKVFYAGRKAEQPTPGADNIPSYFTGDLPEQRPGWRDMILSRRRPELYSILPTINEVIMKYRPEKGPW